MSAIFDLDTEGQGALAEQAKENGISIDQLQSGFFDGVPKAIGMGVMRGGARAARAVGLAGGGLLSLMEDHPGDLTDPYFKALDDYTGNAVDYWTPGANEVGTAGKILGGFSEMALPLMAGGGNPALLIGTAELGGAQDLAEQGASTTGAVAGGIVQGAAAAAGFKIPFLGKTLATKLVSGLAGNVGAGVAGRVAEQQVLSRTGNAEQAAQIAPFDPESLVVDALTGLAFGGVAHGATKLAERMTPSVRDAVATAANAKHFQQDTAPGIPADITASIAHQAAMEAAINDTLQGKPVDLSRTGVMDADFVALPRPFGHLAEVPEELKGVDEAIKDRPAGNPERVDLEVPDIGTADGGAVAGGQANADGGTVPAGGARAGALELARPSGDAGSNQGPVLGQRAVDPVVSAAHEAVAEKDFQVPTGETDADGRMVTRSAREVLDEANADVATAQNDAKAFDALVGCILFRGNG